MSKCILVVGGTGCGKTYFTKNELLNRVNRNALLIFDTNNEYQDIYPYPFDPDIDLFLKKVYKTKNAVILIEDATAFISNQGRKDLLVKILVGKRHTKNTIILLFHSFRQIPKYVFDLSNIVVIFRTNDPITKLEVFENEELTATWQDVQNAAKEHPFWSTYPPPKGVTPPKKLFRIY